MGTFPAIAVKDVIIFVYSYIIHALLTLSVYSSQNDGIFILST
jgi:hypothetical protein